MGINDCQLSTLQPRTILPGIKFVDAQFLRCEPTAARATPHTHLKKEQPDYVAQQASQLRLGGAGLPRKAGAMQRDVAESVVMLRGNIGQGNLIDPQQASASNWLSSLSVLLRRCHHRARHRQRMH